LSIRIGAGRPKPLPSRKAACGKTGSAEEWQRKTARKGTLAEFLMQSPLRGADLDPERQRDEPRDLQL